MVTIKVISGNHVEDKKIPQGFDDVQWCDYVAALSFDKDAPVSNVLSALTGIDVMDLEGMSQQSQAFILDSCKFFWNESPEFIDIPEAFKGLSIAQGTWQNLVDCENEFQALQRTEMPQIAAGQMIIKTYTKGIEVDGKKLVDGVSVSGMKVPEALGYWNFFFCSLNNGKSNGSICTPRNPTTMRLQRVLKRYRDSDSLPLYTRLLKGMYLNTTRYYRQQPTKFTPRYCLRKQNAIIVKTCNTTTRKQTRP
tara:strand:+ start:547 stop:1299 length:753 start_codon:yes stop_codon:yes gene_type:complete